MERVKEVEKVPPESRLTDQNVTRLATTCSSFIRNYGFILSELTEEERSFPIAFSILTFKDAEQVLNLLRAIYRPQNVYCVHVDSKSDHSFREAITAISSCFPNVFLSSRSVNVRWGQFSVLEPELVCMQDLWNYTHWKYLINLTGQEFPLRTNYELVKILTAYNGANDLEVHITVNRDFVDYVLHSQVAKDFLDWCRRVNVPDETFFASLNHNPQLVVLNLSSRDG
nr:hypothetical protein BaRGS_015738 [Batillaria attramentaria]